jgi:hypothetical protein
MIETRTTVLMPSAVFFKTAPDSALFFFTVSRDALISFSGRDFSVFSVFSACEAVMISTISVVLARLVQARIIRSSLVGR